MSILNHAVRPVNRVFGLGILPTAPAFDLGTTDPRPAAVLALLADRGYGRVRLDAVRLAMELDQKTAASAPAVDPSDKPDVRAILNPPARRRGPSAADVAYKLGFDLGMQFERPCGPPAHFTSAERRAFGTGQADASREIEQRDAARALAHAEAVEMSGLSCWHADAYAMA